MLAFFLAAGLAGCWTSTAQPTPAPSAAPASTPLPSASPTPPPQPATLTPTFRGPAPAKPSPVTPTVSPTPAPPVCLQNPGRVVFSSQPDRRLKLPMEYGVYLPPCYDEEPQRRYPVLYLIHGQNYNNDQWDRLGADETAARLISAGEVLPFIIVMPRDRLWEQPENDPFGEVLVEKLIPRIDGEYRTLAERRYRAVGGLSRGAGWAVHLGLSRWDLFGALGGHSLPVFWSDTGKVRGWLADIPPEELPRIYIDIGEKDRPAILESALWFEQVLTENDIPHEWHLFPGYHEEAYWSAHVEQYLRWYASGW